MIARRGAEACPMRIGQTRGFGEHCTVGIDNGGGQTKGGEAQTDEMGALEAAMDAAGDGVDGGGIIAGLEADGLAEQRQAIFGRATIAPGGDQPKGERGSDGRQGYWRCRGSVGPKVAMPAAAATAPATQTRWAKRAMTP